MRIIPKYVYYIIGFFILSIIVELVLENIDGKKAAITRLKKQHEFEIKKINEEKVKELNQKIHEINQNKLNEINELKEANYNEIQEILKSFNSCQKEAERLQKRNELLEPLLSNTTAFPYMASIIADYETYGLEKLAQSLDWGESQERAKKVKAIREIRKDAKAMIEKYKESHYQLQYLLSMFPTLNDVIECDYNQLPAIDITDNSNHDMVRDYMTKDEYNSLSVTERNQLALDRYKNSHKKTKWQIGRDYEQYIGYRYSKMGYTIDYFGSYMGLEDLGRDLIAKRDGKTLIIQCKYWSSIKQIHEKHIMQLYGTMVSYCIENNTNQEQVAGVLVTNIKLSDTAKRMANYLRVTYAENIPLSDYPCIKCNIGHDQFGITKIYHLPFDQQYDSTKIEKNGEFYAMTVKEAEQAGFRRAFKWFG